MNKSRIIYISSFIPREIKEDIVSSLKNFNFNSADTFSYAVFDGLCRNIGTDFDCINIAPVGAFPRFNYSSRLLPNTYKDQGVEVNSIGFSTLTGYMYFSIYKNLLKWLKDNLNVDSEYIFLVYSINIPVLKALINYRNKHRKSSKIILIIPDQIEDFNYYTITSKIKRKLFGNVQKIYKEMNGFVLLTEQMKDRIGVSRPYTVVEGIYNTIEKRELKVVEDNIKSILYTGMLYEKFGVKTLIDAFMKTSNINYRLEICGVGELNEYISKMSKIDNRIIFHGLVSREKVLEMQSSATLLVNPRQPLEDFTKYSFPSKNIEYLASGRPVLLYDLPGIPNEYYDYCFHISHDHLDIGSLSSNIEHILNLPSEELIKIGTNAAMFIKDKKNSKVQVNKILNLIDTIS